MNSDFKDQFTVDASNPLLEKLPREMSFLEWGEMLHHDPRDRWRRPFGKRPESHARVIRNLVVPTERLITVAVNLQGALINSLRERDPRLAVNRRRAYELAEFKDFKLDDELSQLPWFSGDAPGAILRGPTGMSKSHSLGAFLGRLPRVVVHGANPECGWAALKQLVYLKVYMPDDANRKSFYMAVALGIDQELGTSHAQSLNRMTNGRALLEVLTLLTIYRCGLLIVEEAQLRNMGPKVLGSEFVATFLRIMNCGVPLVLVGNPLAFTNVLSFSQDLRRFSAEGIYDFSSVYHYLDDEWTQDLVPAIWGWTLFDKPDETPGSELFKYLYDRTGGRVDILSRYREACIVNALRRGASRVEKTDLEAGYQSPTLRSLHQLATAYANKDIDALSKFSDQPLQYLQEIWAGEKARRNGRTSKSADNSQAS